MKIFFQFRWIALALLIPSTLAAQDPDVTVEQTCAPFKNWQAGPAARPTEADRKAFGREKNCFGHFYSADVKPDYDKGRRCCLVRGDCNREPRHGFCQRLGHPARLRRRHLLPLPGRRRDGAFRTGGHARVPPEHACRQGKRAARLLRSHHQRRRHDLVHQSGLRSKAGRVGSPDQHRGEKPSIPRRRTPSARFRKPRTT